MQSYDLVVPINAALAPIVTILLHTSHDAAVRPAAPGGVLISSSAIGAE
jgi:hypothetical protein